MLDAAQPKGSLLNAAQLMDGSLHGAMRNDGSLLCVVQGHEALLGSCAFINNAAAASAARAMSITIAGSDSVSLLHGSADTASGDTSSALISMATLARGKHAMADSHTLNASGDGIISLLLSLPDGGCSGLLLGSGNDGSGGASSALISLASSVGGKHTMGMLGNCDGSLLDASRLNSSMLGVMKRDSSLLGTLQVNGSLLGVTHDSSLLGATQHDSILVVTGGSDRRQYDSASIAIRFDIVPMAVVEGGVLQTSDQSNASSRLAVATPPKSSRDTSRPAVATPSIEGNCPYGGSSALLLSSAEGISGGASTALVGNTTCAASRGAAARRSAGRCRRAPRPSPRKSAPRPTRAGRAAGP